MIYFRYASTDKPKVARRNDHLDRTDFDGNPGIPAC
jgi:hypothetical protein